jgi:predicted ATPase
MAKREMQSWRQLRLEPVALRKPDELPAQTMLGADGSHLAATLYNLARMESCTESRSAVSDSVNLRQSRIYAGLSARLAEFMDDAREITVDHDEKRELLTVTLSKADGTQHAARSLSDGTLRFLAIALLELDRESTGLFCLEEPENGIYPDRIRLLTDILQEIAVDVCTPVGPDNPLRQVIINTHSPVVIAQVPDDSLLVAELAETMKDGLCFKSARFSCLPNTWRQTPQENISTIDRERLSSYRDPIQQQAPEQHIKETRSKASGAPRRSDETVDQMQPNLPYGE